jgi:hypothetical protein
LSNSLQVGLKLKLNVAKNVSLLKRRPGNEFGKWMTWRLMRGYPVRSLINKKAILRMAFFCLRTLLVSGWDGALTFLYGVAIAIKRVPGENGLA